MPTKLSFEHHWLVRYGSALAAVGAGLLLRLGLTALVGPGLPTYVTFYPPVMVAALLCGFGPGLLATLIVALVADYWLLDPLGQFGISSPAEAVGLAFFSGMGVFMSVVAELYRRARQATTAHDTELLRREGQKMPRQPMKETVLLVGGLVLSLAILGAVGWQTYRHLTATVQADRWVSHTYTVNDDLEHLFATVEDMEASERGYLIMGEEDYLRPYNTAKRTVAGQLASLKRLTEDNAGQAQRLKGIEALVDAKLEELKEVIEVRRSQGLEAAHNLMASGKGQTLTEEIRKRITEAEAEEQLLLQLRSSARDADLRKTLQALVAGGVLGLLLLTTIFLFLTQENSRRRRAEAELRRHQEDLQGLVATRTADLSQANESLRQQREWLKVTLSSIGDAVLATDTAGHITFLNPVAETLTGWEEKEALSQPVQNVFQIINEETRAPGEDIVARVLREGRAVALANHTALVTRGGGEVPIDDSAAPIKDSAGTVSGAVLVFHDVTERRGAQASMRESERQFRTLADSIPNLACWANGDGYITWYNQRWYNYTGTTPKEMEGWGWQSVHDPQTLPTVLERWKASIATGEPFDMTFPLHGADGVFRPFLTRVMPLKDAQGRVQQWFGMNTDVSEQKKAEETVRELNAERVNADLQKAIESLDASLNLMDDAVRARKQAEQATADLRSAAEQRRLALEAADLGAWDYNFQTGEVFWDDRCREMWGVPQAETVNYDGAIAVIHPEDRAGVDEAVQQALAGKDGGAYHREFRVVWPDGSVHWIASHGHVYFQGEGNQRRAVRFIGANQEITRRRQREEELRRLNRTLKAHSKSDQALMRAKGESNYLEAVCRIVVEDCGHAMVWVGFAEDNEAKTVRPAAQAGFEEGYLETLNLTWADTERGRGPTGTAIRIGQPSLCRNMLTDPRFAPWRAEALKRGYASSLVLPLMAEGRAFGALTIYARQPDGFSDDEVRLLTDLAGDLAYGVTALRVRAAKARAEEALRQTAEDLRRSNRDLEQFAYVASHDLQEPLRAVGGYVKLLQHRFPDKLDDKARGYIAGAFEGATRMERLISDLLAYSRVGTRGGEFDLANLDAVLEHALGNLETSIKSAQATITHDVLPALSVDATQIMQLFQNLIGNALKFRDQQAQKIHVGAQRQEGRWIFSVRDNGIGIEPQYYEKIFQIFQRLHTRKDYPGTGMGLAICKRIVERHGGTIWVESQPGQGSTFCFSIPIAASTGQPLAAGKA